MSHEVVKGNCRRDLLCNKDCRFLHFTSNSERSRIRPQTQNPINCCFNVKNWILCFYEPFFTCSLLLLHLRWYPFKFLLRTKKNATILAMLHASCFSPSSSSFRCCRLCANGKLKIFMNFISFRSLPRLYVSFAESFGALGVRYDKKQDRLGSTDDAAHADAFLILFSFSIIILERIPSS